VLVEPDLFDERGEVRYATYQNALDVALRHFPDATGCPPSRIEKTPVILLIVTVDP
jgi:hypothetical protein